VRTVYGPVAKDRGLVLTMEIAGPIAVTSDERRIRQIIMNLVSNAIKFTDEGSVEVNVEQKGTVVEVSVRDTGDRHRKGRHGATLPPLRPGCGEGAPYRGDGTRAVPVEKTCPVPWWGYHGGE